MEREDVRPNPNPDKDAMVAPQSPSLSVGSIDPNDLAFVTGNRDKEETILLIHGAGASGTDWSLVTPYLSSYHLLLPSLFVESSLQLVRQTRSSVQNEPSKSPNPQRWDSCYAYHLAELVRKHAKNGRAHVVGLSFGACLAVRLTAAYPELCQSVFVSGIPTMVQSSIPSIMRPVGTGVFWTAHFINKALGPKNVGKFLDGEVDVDAGFWDGKGGGSTVEVNAILSETFVAGQQDRQYVNRIASARKANEMGSQNEELRIRFVAATRRNKWTPVSDATETAIEIAQMMLGQEKDSKSLSNTLIEGVDCRVYDAKQMFHPWSRQKPELFAQCILATVQNTEFPTNGLSEVWRHPSSPVPPQ